HCCLRPSSTGAHYPPPPRRPARMREMPSPIEDYAIIADCRSTALVAKDGSIDWLCLPRFDSDACFAALLGSREHGRWQIAPEGGVRRVRRRYRESTLILETEYETEEEIGRASCRESV